MIKVGKYENSCGKKRREWNKMNFTQAIEYLMTHPQGAKVKANKWDNDYIYIDKSDLSFIKTNSGEMYYPCAWTIVNDTWEVIE